MKLNNHVAHRSIPQAPRGPHAAGPRGPESRGQQPGGPQGPRGPQDRFEDRRGPGGVEGGRRPPRGELTRPEAAELRGDQAGLQGARAAARADGQVTGAEARQLHEQQRELRRDMFASTHNSDRWPKLR